MKAIFGKLSILSFLILITAWLITELTGMRLGLYSEFAVLQYPIGFLFGYLSLLKQETPKCYRYIGFFLNFVLLFLLVSVFL